MYGPTQPLGNITDQWARIEFQKRDSPHVHSLLWVKEAPNLDTIQGQRDAPTFIAMSNADMFDVFCKLGLLSMPLSDLF
jgi:hypothetical protein